MNALRKPKLVICLFGAATAAPCTAPATFTVAWRHHSRVADGSITHAVEDGRERSICGVLCTEFGFLDIPAETSPCCRRCHRILRRLGILTDND